MIDKTTIITFVLKKLNSLPVGDYLDVRSYKRNRSIIIIKKTENLYRLIENGFEQHRFDTTKGQLRSLLKRLIKKEFPRSRKLRVYTLKSWRENQNDPVERKKI